MQVITFSDFVILYLERNYLDKFCDCVVGKMRGYKQLNINYKII